MKIAIQFYGFARHYETNHSLWQRLIKTYNADVFIHTWDTVQFKDNSPIIKEGSSGLVKTNKSQLDVDKLKKLYNPKAILVQDYDDYHPTFVGRAQILENLRITHLNKNPNDEWAFKGRYTPYMSMYYSWWKVSQLKQKYEIENNFLYDIVLHTRMDFALTDIFTFDLYDYALVSPPWPNDTTEHWVDYDKGINDYWIYGVSKTIDMYCSVYPRLEKIWDYCMRDSQFGFKEASNPHSIPVTNVGLGGITRILKMNNQHGNLLRGNI
jgi:hypothetical protein